MSISIRRATVDDSMMCIEDGCYRDATWFVEGDFYCNEHKKEFIKTLYEGGEGE